MSKNSFEETEKIVHEIVVNILAERSRTCPECGEKQGVHKETLNDTKSEFFCVDCRVTYDVEIQEDEVAEILKTVREVVLAGTFEELKKKGIVKGSLEEGYSLTSKGIKESKEMLKILKENKEKNTK